MNKLVIAGVLGAAAVLWYLDDVSAPPAPASRIESVAPDKRIDTVSEIDRAFEARQSDVQVRGQGVVLKLLSDDNKGSRHQRFILRLPSGNTLLVAHNIDLAPRIESLRVGDDVEFFGEYEWNDKGGVLHWTHDDPQGRHVAGWLRHRGVRYQ
jgi:hypothetical protein